MTVDSIEVSVDEEEYGKATGGRFIIRVGRLAVAREEVPIARMSHCRACLVVLRAALRVLDDSTSEPVAVVVPDRTAIWLLSPDGAQPEPALVHLVEEVRGQLQDKTPRRQLVHQLPEPRELPSPSESLTLAPFVFTHEGVRRVGYLGVVGDMTISRSMPVRTSMSREEALLRIVRLATDGLDRGAEVEIWSRDPGLFALLNPVVAPRTTSVLAASLVRALESSYRLSVVLAGRRELQATLEQNGALHGGSL